MNTLRILTDAEVAEYHLEQTLSGQDKARRAAAFTPCQCTCGRFAKFIRYEANTMPHGESVTTVDCSRCGRVYIR